MENAAVGIGELNTAARHHARGYVEKLRHRHIHISRSAALAERSNKRARKAAAVDIHPNAEHRGGVEHRIDATFRVVAHNHAAKLQAGAQKTLRGVIPQLYLRIVIFEIRGRASGPYITPLANHGIAQETIVRLVGVALHHHIVELAANLAPGADSSARINLGAHVHHSVLAQSHRSAQSRALHNLGMRPDINRAVSSVEKRTFHHGAFFEKNQRRVANHSIGPAQRRRHASLRKSLEVGHNGPAVQHEDIPEILDAANARHRCGIYLLGALGGIARKFFGKIVDSAHGSRRAFQPFPLLTYSGDSHTQARNRASISHRQKIEPGVLIVNKDIIRKILKHVFLIFVQNY